MANRNFMQVLRGLDVSMAVAELARQPELWNQFTARQDYPGSAHHDTKCIVLRGTRPDSTVNVFDDLLSVPWPVMASLPACGYLAVHLIRERQASQVGRVLLAQLKPGGVIDEHIDEGAYAEHFTRYHIPLVSEPGNWFDCGGETVEMHPGTAWWFNHHLHHSVRNESNAPRTHLIVDLAGFAS